VEARVSARLTSAEGRRFGLTVGAAFVVLGGVLWYRGRHPGDIVALALGGALLLAALAVPSWLGPVRSAWLGLGTALSRVTTPIFMGVIYFVVITPIGLLMRLRGRNPLTRSRGPGTIWVLRPLEARSRRDMHRQF
jgi:hypothetical protein